VSPPSGTAASRITAPVAMKWARRDSPFTCRASSERASVRSIPPGWLYRQMKAPLAGRGKGIGISARMAAHYGMAAAGTGSRTETMDPRLLDILTGAASLLIFIILLIGLPLALPGNPGFAYLLALLAFIGAMAAAGWLIRGAIR